MKVKTKLNIHDHVWDEYNHQTLKANKEYVVIGISYDSYRVIDEMKEPILCPKYLFNVVESSIPEDWIKEEYPDDEYYIDPPELCKQGFYEAYFDGKPEAIAIFEQFLIRTGLK